MSTRHYASKLIATYAQWTSAGGEFVPSPCVAVCSLNDTTDQCEGCFRTLDEIAIWSECSAEQKRALWESLVQRARQIGSTAT